MNVADKARDAPSKVRSGVLNGELDPSILVSHRMPLEDAPRGYELFKDKEDGCMRAVFEP